MIYLRTGANGAGKTLLTLKEVREKQLKESRPVYYNGRFEMVADFGWQKLDAKDWQTVPDGAIFLWDEVQNDLPVRKGGEPPEWIRMLAEHRRRGFDFFMISQHPLNIDAFVRRLIGAPGWHQHLKRASGAPLVSVLEWASVNDQCQKAGAGESGSVRMVPYPREVYDWYRSTSLDTAKLKIPFRVWVLGACAVLVPASIFFGVKTFRSSLQAREDKLASLSGRGPGQLPAPGARPVAASGSGAAPLSPAEWAATWRERVPGMAFSAPRYDALTTPTVAPYPAACVQSKAACKCFSQQATPLVVPKELCAQIAATGWFQDWAPVASTPGQQAGPAAPATVAPATAPAPKPDSAGTGPLRPFVGPSDAKGSSIAALAAPPTSSPWLDSHEQAVAKRDNPADLDLVASARAYRRKP